MLKLEKLSNTNLIYAGLGLGDSIAELEEIESERMYCRHDLSHFLSVARICHILCLENSLKIKKDIIYTTALLHDIGRIAEYKEGRAHDEVSLRIAESLLEHSDYSIAERELICSAIACHRKEGSELDFPSIFYWADKLSRDCFNCKRYEDCKWQEDRKNKEIVI